MRFRSVQVVCYFVSIVCMMVVAVSTIIVPVLTPFAKSILVVVASISIVGASYWGFSDFLIPLILRDGGWNIDKVKINGKTAWHASRHDVEFSSNNLAGLYDRAIVH